MFANPLFYYSCGHVCDTFLPGRDSNANRRKICPLCREGAVATIEYDCEFCGQPVQTTAGGFGRCRRLFCANCRKTYNRWESMKRKAESARRMYPAFAEYACRPKNLVVSEALPEPPPEPPLKPREFAEIAKYGKRASPCAACPHIIRDKNEEPCAACAKRALFAQTPAKIHLDSLYL